MKYQKMCLMGHSPEWRYTMRINVTVTYKNGLKDTTMVKNEAEKTYLKNMLLNNPKVVKFEIVEVWEV